MKFYFVTIGDRHYIHATKIADDNRDAVAVEVVASLREVGLHVAYPTVKLTPLANAGDFTAAIRFELGDLTIF